MDSSLAQRPLGHCPAIELVLHWEAGDQKKKWDMEQEWTATLKPAQESTPRGLLAPKGRGGSGRRTLQVKNSTGPWLSKVCSSAWLPSAGQLTQSIPCLLPVPIYHPTHCRAQSVWPQLSWKARPLILSLQAAGRNCRTISPPTIKNHITEGSGAGPAFHHGGVCGVSCCPGDAISQTRPRSPSATNLGPKCPCGIPTSHPIYCSEGHLSSRDH